MGASTPNRRLGVVTTARADGSDGPTVDDDVPFGITDQGAVAQVTPTIIVDDADPWTLQPGSMVGEYQIGAKLGEGGMGVVYAATHPRIGKRAAVKVVRPGLCEDAVAVARFVDEARAVNQIGHRNIVDVFAFGELPDGRSYFVMEWLVGDSLRTAIGKARLPLGEALRIGSTVAQALEAAHEAGVIHRDLKPDNVFLVTTKHGPPEVKLLDFGIAKLTGTDRPGVSATQTGEMIGTPMYMSPEQARGKGVDARTDIYALGVMMFELIAGQPPFRADNAMELVAMHLTEPAPPLASVARVPTFLAETVDAMLAKRPDERPSLAVARAVFERALLTMDGGALRRERERATLAPPPTTAAPGRRHVRAIIAGVGLATLGAGGVWLATRDHGVAPRAPAATSGSATPDGHAVVVPADARPPTGSDARYDAATPDAHPVHAVDARVARTPDAAGPRPRPDARPRPRPDARPTTGTGSGSGGPTRVGDGLLPPPVRPRTAP